MLLLKRLAWVGIKKMTDLEVIASSLEQIGAAEIDLVPLVYERFFLLCPDAKPLFATREAQSVQGKMVNELIQTVLDRLEEKPYSAVVVQTMVSDHDGWGVKITMYDAFLMAFLDALQGALNLPDDALAITAWQRQLTALKQEIATHLSA
jgi:hemoglobin-like flavoprotein